MMYATQLTYLIKIIVEDKLENIAEEELFIDLCKQKKKVEILFVNVKFLQLNVVKVIIETKSFLSIESTEKSLWNYLHKFRVSNTYKNSVTNKKYIPTSTPICLAIGGSAGSIPKIKHILDNLPFADISVFITVHVKEHQKNALKNIFQNECKYKVLDARHELKVERNCVYIAVPDYHMVVKNGTIYIENTEKVCFAKPSISVMFESLAHEYKGRILAVILSGYGRDGASSLEILKKKRARIIIENPNECEAQDMPLNAIITKNYDHILSLEKIVSYIDSLFSAKIDYRDEINSFIENIYNIYGYDFRTYDYNSLSRRIDLAMKSFNTKSFKEFECLILENFEVFDKLLKEFSINVTSFFRDPLVYKAVREDIVPELSTYPYIRIWCAGCSRGDEPYSVAMMLDEAGLLAKTQIYATDFNPTILEEAKNGLFSKDEYLKFKKNYTTSGGELNFDDWFHITDDYIEVKQNIKKNILFFKHNLVSDASINQFNLILCRNVIIYFDRQLKRKVFDTFDDSLEGNSFLILGSSETIDTRLKYKTINNEKYRIYHKGY